MCAHFSRMCRTDVRKTPEFQGLTLENQRVNVATTRQQSPEYGDTASHRFLTHVASCSKHKELINEYYFNLDRMSKVLKKSTLRQLNTATLLMTLNLRILLP